MPNPILEKYGLKKEEENPILQKYNIAGSAPSKPSITEVQKRTGTGEIKVYKPSFYEKYIEPTLQTIGVVKTPRIAQEEIEFEGGFVDWASQGFPLEMETKEPTKFKVSVSPQVAKARDKLQGIGLKWKKWENKYQKTPLGKYLFEPIDKESKLSRAALDSSTAASAILLGVVGTQGIMGIKHLMKTNQTLKAFKNIGAKMPQIEAMLAKKGFKFPDKMPLHDRIGYLAARTEDWPSLGTLLNALATGKPPPGFVSAHSMIPYVVGQAVKYGDQVGKIANITGNTAMIITEAGRQIMAKIADLKPFEAPLSPEGIPEVAKPPKEAITPGIIPKPPIVEPEPLIEEAKGKNLEEFVKLEFGAEPAAAIPGEAISFLGAEKGDFDTAQAQIIYDEKDNQPLGYKIVLRNGQELANPKSEKIGGSPYFGTMEEAQAYAKSQLTDIWNKAQGEKVKIHKPGIPKTIGKEPQIEPFTNFESKKSPISLLDREMNEINGLRLSGKFTPQQANKQIQEIKKRKIEYAKEKGIAITKTQSGKTRIAIRRSGFYAKKEIETASIHNVYSQFQAPSGMALMQDGYEKGGKFGIIYKEVWMPTKKSIAESIGKKNKFDNEVKEILKKHKFPITKKNGNILSDMLEKKIKIPSRYKELVKDIRQYMDDKRDLANDVREKMGKSKMGYIENYVPHIQETSIWNELVGNDITITDNFDFIIPNQARNPFAYRRLLKEMMDPERNFFSLVERYNSAIAKDIHINPAIENIKAYNTVLKDKGLFKASKFWDEYIRTGLLGKQHKIDSALSVDPIVRKGLKKWKDILNKAFLTGKVSWNIATQPLSYITLTPTEAGYKNAIKAVFKMFNKGIRRSVRENSISLKIKSKDILSDAIGEGRGYANRIYRTKIDKWNDMISIISSIEEQLLHQTSYIAGLDRAKELGYTGEDAHMFADLCAERTQSMYNKENRALILNSDITTAAIPFQSFATELSNHAKEILTKTKGAMRLNARQRVGKLIRLLIGIWLSNQYAKALTGREKTTVGTFIPFAGETVDRLISNATKKGYVTTRSPVSQVQQVEDLIKASKDYLKYGDTKRLRKIGITFGPALLGAGGGGQISNLVDGIIADIEGEVKSARGRTLFSIKDLESQIKAPIFGVWSTKGGREYWDKRQGKKPQKPIREKTILEKYDIKTEKNPVLEKYGL